MQILPLHCNAFFKPHTFNAWKVSRIECVTPLAQNVSAAQSGKECDKKPFYTEELSWKERRALWLASDIEFDVARPAQNYEYGPGCETAQFGPR